MKDAITAEADKAYSLKTPKAHQPPIRCGVKETPRARLVAEEKAKLKRSVAKIDIAAKSPPEASRKKTDDRPLRSVAECECAPDDGFLISLIDNQEPQNDFSLMTHVEGRFEWDTVKAEKNFAKHGVTFADAIRVLDGDPVVTLDAATSPTGEVRKMALGRLDGLIIAAVITTARGERIRIISARPASQSERKTYHEKT